jgi:hypothetical protein
MIKHGPNPDGNPIKASARPAAGAGDRLSPRELARVAANGPATTADARAILSSPETRRRLGGAWADQCPSPDLLARAVPPECGTPQHELALLIRQVLLELHVKVCARCCSWLAALERDDLLLRELRGRAAEPASPGRDWWPTVRLSADQPEPTSDDDDLRASLRSGRIVIQAKAFLAAGEVHATHGGPAPAVRRAVLRRDGSHSVATVHVPDDDATIYLDIALDREPALGRIAEVDFAAGAAAAAGLPMTSERRSYPDVRVTSADSRTATLRVVTGVAGSSVRLRLAGPEPSGGIWTPDGQRLAPSADVVVPSPPVPVEQILRALEMR